MPSRLDSSRRSATPSIFFSLTSSAMRSISFALLTWYGISVTTIASLSPRAAFSMMARARTWTVPRPVL